MNEYIYTWGDGQIDKWTGWIDGLIGLMDAWVGEYIHV